MQKEHETKSPVVKRSIVVGGHRTSVSLEDAFWLALKDIARERAMTIADLVSTIDTDRAHSNLSSGIRLFVLDHYQSCLEQNAAGRGHPSRHPEAADSVPLADC